MQLEIDHAWPVGRQLMNSLHGIFWCRAVARSGTLVLGRGNPPYPAKHILNLKLTKYNRWKLSVSLVCDFGAVIIDCHYRTV